MTRGGRNVYVSPAKRAAYIQTLKERAADLTPQQYATLFPYHIPIPAKRIASNRIKRLPKWVKAAIKPPGRTAKLLDLVSSVPLMKGKIALMRLQRPRRK